MNHLIRPIFAMLLFSTSVVSQEVTQSTDPPLTVLEKSWSKEVVRPGRDSNPLGPNEDYMRQAEADKAVVRSRENRSPRQTTEQRMPIPPGKSPILTAAPIWTSYVYKVKVKNTSSKPIKTFYWQYQFLDPNTHHVLGDLRFESMVDIGPGKTKVVKRHSSRLPGVTVSADQLDKRYRDQFTERVIIDQINYADGTVWQRPPTQ